MDFERHKKDLIAGKDLQTKITALLEKGERAYENDVAAKPEKITANMRNYLDICYVLNELIETYQEGIILA